MTIEDLELHDSLIRNMSVDYVNNIARIDIEYYASDSDKNRTGATIVFNGLHNISQITNLQSLNKNAFAGNINSWTCSTSEGRAYIYLVDGCIELSADSISIHSK